tara:strand:+ start:4538 stop:4669 length:132 start_codon:yes stop_codon:yes gene_type:complete
MGFYKWIKQKRLRKKRKAKIGRKKGENKSYKIKKDKEGKNIRG